MTSSAKTLRALERAAMSGAAISRGSLRTWASRRPV